MLNSTESLCMCVSMCMLFEGSEFLVYKLGHSFLLFFVFLYIFKIYLFDREGSQVGRETDGGWAGGKKAPC